MTEETTATQETTEAVKDVSGDTPQQTAGVQEITRTKEDYDKDLRRYADQHLSKSMPNIERNIKEKIEQEVEERIKQAEERASMSADQLIEAREKDLEAKEKALDEQRRVYELKDQLKDYLVENSVDVSLLPVVLSNDLESSKNNLEIIQSVIEKAVTDNENKWITKGGTPKSGVSQPITKEWRDMTPTERLEIKTSDPALYARKVVENANKY